MSEGGDGRTDGPLVVSFSDEGATDRALVGGKGANLSRLASAGLPVPEGFCVTTVAYGTFVSDPALRERIRGLSALDPEDTAALAEAGTDVRERIEGLDVPDEIRDAIAAALAEVGGDAEEYAVRSSATAEDLPDASFAGQQETYLDVRGTEAVVDRVRACMASLFTDRAIAYRAKNDVSSESVATAVVVQRMVSPDASGVLFTADPLTGNRHVASIEAVRGLGEALVSGEADADSVRLDTRTGDVLDYDVGDQRVAVRPRPEGGTETVEVPPAERGSRVLTHRQIASLVEIGTEIQTLFDAPQDVEWCLVGDDDDIYVVQARPITSLFPVPSPEPTDGRLHVYYSVGHAQAFAEAIPPLVRDIWISYTDATFGMVGLNADLRGAVEAGGRLYVDLTPFLRIDPLRDRIPDQLSAVSEPIGVGIEDVLSRRPEEFRDQRTLTDRLALVRPVAGALRRHGRTAYTLLSSMFDGFLGAFVGDPVPPASEEAMWDAWGRDIAEKALARDTPAERARAVFAFLDDSLEFPSTGRLFAALVAGGWLQRRFSDAPEEMDAISGGFPRELVTRINLGLGDLADVAREHPDVADALRDGASLETLESLDGGDAFLTALDDYLDEFGHRGTGEIDISRPRWREDPSGLLAAVRANLEHGEAGEHRERLRRMQREANAAAARLERRVDHGPLGPLRRRLVRRMIRTYRAYVQTREYPKQGSARMFAAWHDVLRDAGESLVGDGVLARPDDVWFLHREELFAALDGEPLDVDIAARRAEFERHAAMDAPAVLTSEGEVPSARLERDHVPEGALVGTGVSGGVVEGVARVVFDPAEETIRSGEILVAPSSDPGWTPLFLNAAGMVVEVGGRMSHGALVAREYGLPAVVSVPDATRRIETGQRVRIDGTRGTVEIMDGSDADEDEPKSAAADEASSTAVTNDGGETGEGGETDDGEETVTGEAAQTDSETETDRD